MIQVVKLRLDGLVRQPPQQGKKSVKLAVPPAVSFRCSEHRGEGLLLLGHEFKPVAREDPHVLNAGFGGAQVIQMQYLRRRKCKCAIQKYRTNPRPGIKLQIRDLRRSEEHTSELQSRLHLVCRLLLEKKKQRGARSALSSYLDQAAGHALS